MVLVPAQFAFSVARLARRQARRSWLAVSFQEARKPQREQS